jgi:hypothetical protein
VLTRFSTATVILVVLGHGAAVTSGQTPPSDAALTEQDRAEIQLLVNRYAAALSSCAAQEYSELFTPDGVFASDDFRGARHREIYGTSARLVGRAKLVELVQTEEHCLRAPSNAAVAAGTATSPRPAPRVSITATPDGATGTVSLGNGGRYEDVYVRTPEGWRFKSRTVHMPPASAEPGPPRSSR